MVKQESCADALESQSSFKPHQKIEYLLQPIIWNCRVKQKHNANKRGRFSQHYLGLHKAKQLPYKMRIHKQRPKNQIEEFHSRKKKKIKLNLFIFK